MGRLVYTSLALLFMGSLLFSQGGAGKQEGVTGRVSDSNGNPVRNALVHPKSLDENSPPIPEIAVVTDEDGRYTWRLFPGRYDISVSAQGYGELTEQVTVKPKQQVILDFTLEQTK